MDNKNWRPVQGIHQIKNGGLILDSVDEGFSGTVYKSIQVFSSEISCYKVGEIDSDGEFIANTSEASGIEIIPFNHSTSGKLYVEDEEGGAAFIQL